jgi:cysteinyl-tRNA synthetase
MMKNPIFIYNTLTRKKEPFEPLKKGIVNMYVCGITPYDDAHLGHGRCYVTFDIIRRYLEHKGFKVNYIQNVTDIDDKIIKRAREYTDESKDIKEKCRQLTEKYFSEYKKLMAALNVKEPTMFVKATETIADMQEVISALIKKEFAYELEGDVYFAVRKFNNYGQLSGRNIEEMRSGARVEVDERKKDPLDFALWKKAKPGEPSWPSPWGEGRPGWHIECSAMSLKKLDTKTLDLHGGGQDLIFPHHENEIAQSEAYTGQPFVKYWVHNGFVMINKEKMSKSLGNFFTLKDIIAQYDPEAVRLFLLSQHYHSPIDFSNDKLEEAKKNIRKFENTLRLAVKKLDDKIPAGTDKDVIKDLVDTFEENMDDDFNTARGVAVLFETENLLAKEIVKDKPDKHQVKKLLFTFNKLANDILGLKISYAENLKDLAVDGKEIEAMIAERNRLRKDQKYKEADEIRQELEKMGIILEDTAQGTRWKKV